MTKQTITMTLLATAVLFGCGKVTQPKPACRTQQSEYAARYLEPEMGANCTPDNVITGEILHLAYYRTTPSGGIPKVGIEPSTIADHVHELDEWNKVNAKEDPTKALKVDGKEYSLGTFKDSQPNDSDICEAPTLSEATVNIPMIPGDPMHMPPIPDMPAATYKYKWSNMRFITQPLSNAIHFGADLERTIGDCTVKYKVSAINPALHCGDGKTTEKDEMGVEHEVDAPWMGKPVPDKCLPSEVGEAHGTGLSPHFVYACDEPTLLCLPTKKFPARK